MRFLMSYGVAFLLLIGLGAWMASGYVVQGGQGPGNGETAALDAVDLPGGDKAKELMVEFGVMASDEEKQAEEEAKQAEEAAAEAEAAALQSVRTKNFYNSTTSAERFTSWRDPSEIIDFGARRNNGHFGRAIC